jgi:hypothetical protein
MPSTLALDSTWDLTLDANGNIATLDEPAALAQDAASAILTFLGECYWDTTVGVPWLQQILGVTPPPLALIKKKLVDAALTVDDVVAAQVFISALSARALSGQVQVISASSGQIATAPFAVSIPQGTF